MKKIKKKTPIKKIHTKKIKIKSVHIISIIILLLIILIVGWLIINEKLNDPRNVVESVMGNEFLPEPIPSCADQDGGLNDFLKGSVRLNGELVATDYCQSNNNLIEHTCNSNNVYGVDENSVVRIPISCEYIASYSGLDLNLGCRNGACVDLNSEPGYVGEYRVGVLKDGSGPCPDNCDVIPQEIDKSINYDPMDETNITCTESDAGIDAAIKGSVTYMDEIVSTDYCLNRKVLIENYCMTENITSPTAFNTEINCSDFNPGFVCKNGACVIE